MLKDKVLELLMEKRGEVIAGSRLAAEFKVSRTAVWKSVHALQVDGHEVIAVPQSGYMLTASSDGLYAPGIQEYLTTKTIGNELMILPETISTNSYIKGMDTAKAPEGLVVVADEQTAGRGRLGREFVSPRGQGIYMSILLKPRLLLGETPFLTIYAAVAVCRALEAVCGISAGIKWVNDIYVEGKKLCGILTEAFVSAEMQSVEYAVLGIGINTGQTAQSVKEIATSTLDITGQSGFRNRLIAQVLNEFEKVYQGYLDRDEKEAILAAYTKRLFIVGKTICVLNEKGGYPATVQGIDENGALIVRTQEGAVNHIAAGEIQLIDGV